MLLASNQIIKSLALLCFLCCFGMVSGQVEINSELYKTLKTNDSLLFDVGFNTCELGAFENLLAEDLEFYHDKGGIMESKKAFVESFKNGICGSPNFKSRRELVAGSLEVYPLFNNGILYGALQQGVHRFFESVNGQPESQGSTAKFTHLWLKEESGWLLKRVLSYDHQMIVVENNTKVITVSEAILASYSGTYKAPGSGTVVISSSNNSLMMKANTMELNIHPSSKTVFFSKEAPLTFEFVVDKEGQVIKFMVFENGTKVEEAVKE